MSRYLTAASALALGALAATTACLNEATRPNESRTTVAVLADTTLIGELVFVLKSGEFDTTSTTTGTRILFRNSTSRRIEQLAIAIQPLMPSSTPLCQTPLRPVVDVVVGTVAPGEERTVLPGLFPPNLTLYVAGAASGAASLVSPTAGRWQGRVDEYRGSAVETRSVLAVSRSDGSAVVYGASPTDRFVYTGTFGPARQLLFFDGVTCNNNWRAVDGTATVVVNPDSIVFRARAETGNGVTTHPDSFVVRLRRR